MQILTELFQVQRYYGTDYLAAVCGLVGMAMLGDRKRSGFLVYMLATSFGMAFSLLAHSFPIMVTNCLMFGLNLRGYLKWRHRRPASES